MPQTYLITGANRGIGLEFARQLKDRGHTVIGTARNPNDADDLKAVADRVLQLDFTDATSVQAFASDLGNTTIDVLINNGATGPLKGTLAELDMEALEREFAVNAVGPMRVTRALLPRIREGSVKKVVFLTSTLASLELTGSAGGGGGGYYAYRSSKAALNMLVRTLADELKDDGFCCFVIHPGWVKTRMGGDNAPMTTEKSVGGMVPVIEDATADEHNGSFLDYRGKVQPW